MFQEVASEVLMKLVLSFVTQVLMQVTDVI